MLIRPEEEQLTARISQILLLFDFTRGLHVAKGQLYRVTFLEGPLGQAGLGKVLEGLRRSGCINSPLH